MANETKTIDISSKIFYLLAALIIVIAVIGIAWVDYNMQSLPQNAPNQITVSGMGKAYAKPDVAVAMFGITEQGQDINQLTTDSNTKMNKMVADLKTLGVAENDIQTTEYNITPQYNYTEKAGQQFSGYQIDEQVTVKIRDFTKVGNVIGTATGDGANNLGNLQFTLDNPNSVQNKAQAQAIANAKANAVALARQSGLTLLKIVSVQTGSSNPVTPMYAQGFASSADVKAVPVPTVQPGQQEVDSNVTITYEVK
jgi:uncharacterized protein YggE